MTTSPLHTSQPSSSERLVLKGNPSTPREVGQTKNNTQKSIDNALWESEQVWSALLNRENLEPNRAIEIAGMCGFVMDERSYDLLPIIPFFSDDGSQCMIYSTRAKKWWTVENVDSATNMLPEIVFFHDRTAIVFGPVGSGEFEYRAHHSITWERMQFGDPISWGIWDLFRSTKQRDWWEPTRTSWLQLNSTFVSGILGYRH